MIAGPLILLVLPLLMAGVMYLLLRWTSVSALLAIGTALVLGIAVLTLPLDQPVHIWGGREIAMGEAVTLFGRELVLEQSDRIAMAFLFLTAAGVFFLAWRMERQPLIMPMGLGLLSLLNGALLIRPLVYAALLIEIAAALSIFALQAEGGVPTRGGLRYLSFTTLALPGLLVTHWLLERYALTPNDTGLLRAAATLLTLSFALLLGVVPFHTWVPAVTSDSVPLAGTFVLTIGNGAVWFLLLDFLRTYPWLRSHPRFESLLYTAGIAMVIVGGLMAPSQRRVGPLIGYAALADSGAALVALGLNSGPGLTLAVLSLMVRPFGLILMAAGLSGLQARSGGDDALEALRGLGWKAPWSTAALVFGGLSVAGLPVSAGFAWRWALCRALVLSSPGAALGILLASAGVMAGVWRALWALLGHHSVQEDGSAPSSSEGWLTAAVIAVVIVACVAIGLFPQLVAPLAGRLAAAYTSVGR